MLIAYTLVLRRCWSNYMKPYKFYLISGRAQANTENPETVPTILSILSLERTNFVRLLGYCSCYKQRYSRLEGLS